MQLLLVLLISLLSISCNARTVQWTSAGGNPLWNNALNWDCRCIPTSSDDVVIDLLAIPAYVQIGGVVAPAECNSLTIGGTSRFEQTLSITGPLNIGAGGGTVNSNGGIFLEAGPDAPLNIDGTFTSRGGRFSFSTGRISGRGSLVFPANTLLNLTTPASKTISIKLQVAGSVFSHGPKGTDIQITKGGSFIIDGVFSATSPLTVNVDSTSAFQVNAGRFDFSGATLGIQGRVGFNKWSLGAGSTATLLSSGSFGSLDLNPSATLILIGSPKETRTFNAVNGQGQVLNQGGANTFNSGRIGSFVASGGNVTFVSVQVQKLVLSGSIIYGYKIFVSDATFKNGYIFKTDLSVNNLILSGVINLDSSILNILNTTTINNPSQITTTGPATFFINSRATVTQDADFKLVSGANSAAANFTQNGVWKVQSSFAIFGVRTNSTGTFKISTGALTLNDLTFSGAAVSNDGVLTVSGGSFNANYIAGSGSIKGSPSSFSVNNLGAGRVTATTGNFVAASATIENLELNGATFVAGRSANIGTFTFTAGSLVGSGLSSSTVNAKSISFPGTTATLTNVSVRSPLIQINGRGNCQLFTNNALLSN